MSEVPLYSPFRALPAVRTCSPPRHLQGYLAHKKHPPPTTLQKDYTLRVLWWSYGGGQFLMSEVTLYRTRGEVGQKRGIVRYV